MIRADERNWFESLLYLRGRAKNEINKFISSRYENKFSQHEIWWINIIDIFYCVFDRVRPVTSQQSQYWVVFGVEETRKSSQKSDEKWKV